MRIDLYGVELLESFILLLEDIERWLWNKGIKQWKPGLHRAQVDDLYRMVLRGGIVAAKSDMGIMGGCILTSEPPKIWKGCSENATYLNSLAVSRKYAGSDISRRIIKFAINQSAKLGVAELRLDCWDGNEFLKQFYADCGFEPLEPQEELGYYVRPFRIQIDN